MLQLHSVSKSYPLQGQVLKVLQDINFSLQLGDKVAILGRNGAGKSTLIRLIGGMEKPDAGHITSTMSISWPLGYAGGVQGSLTGLDNIYFLCRIYGADPLRVKDYVADFTELGQFLWEPVKSYSSGMRGRLGFALSMPSKFNAARGATKRMDYARMGAVGIYTDVLPYSDHVQHANDGLLLPNDPAVWVKTILELADNTALRAEMRLAFQEKTEHTLASD